MADSPQYFSLSPFTFQTLVSDIVSGKILYHEGRGEVLPKFWGGQLTGFFLRVGGKCCQNFEGAKLWSDMSYIFGGGECVHILTVTACRRCCQFFEMAD